MISNDGRAVKIKSRVANNEIAFLKFYGDKFIFNTASGLFYRVTPAAGFLLQALSNGVPEENLAKKLQSAYGISKTIANRDVELFLNDLDALGIAHLSNNQISEGYPS